MSIGQLKTMITALLVLLGLLVKVNALPPMGQSNCISSHYTRPTTFEGGMKKET
jgi:hypothetical protein